MLENHSLWYTGKQNLLRTGVDTVRNLHLYKGISVPINCGGDVWYT